ncbi:hypothetical protein BGZ76_005464 [Entomortierella beljakovae]|nr:hypothetical protein BGZ76_005464 [Entomortierella beljakovae]
MLYSTDIQIHQTSCHAVVVINLKNVDPESISKHIPKDQDCVLVKFEFQAQEGQPKQKQVTLRVQPWLDSDTSNEGGVKLEDCNISITKGNIVLSITKLGRIEWQEIDVQIIGANHIDEAHQESRTKLCNEDEKSIRLGFVTEKNAGRLYQAIQEGNRWKIDGDLRVANTTAKRVTGVNAIQLTAELE